MAEEITLSKEEINDLRKKFEELFYLFKEDPEAFISFKHAPVRFLRNFGIDAMSYINNSLDGLTVSRFSRSIRHIIAYKNVFDRCSWCKILVLTITYAICGKARVPIDAFWGLLSTIIEAIEKVADISNRRTKQIIKYLTNVNKRFSPFTFARGICEQLGYCR